MKDRREAEKWEGGDFKIRFYGTRDAAATDLCRAPEGFVMNEQALPNMDI